MTGGAGGAGVGGAGVGGAGVDGGAAGGTHGGTDVRLLAHVRGQVQGVGFRWWTRSRALELRLVGTARNLPDGRVEVTAQGSRAACEQLLAQLQAPDGGEAAGRRPGSVTGVGVQWLPPVERPAGFAEA